MLLFGTIIRTTSKTRENYRPRYFSVTLVWRVIHSEYLNLPLSISTAGHVDGTEVKKSFAASTALAAI